MGPIIIRILGKRRTHADEGFWETGDLREQGIWGNRGFGGTGDLGEQGIWRNRGFGGTGDLGEQGIWGNRGFGGTGDFEDYLKEFLTSNGKGKRTKWRGGSSLYTSDIVTIY